MRKTSLFIAILCFAAAPSGDALRHVREGNAAFAKGELATAAKQYDAAAMATDDPGLIAFNRAAIHFAEDRFAMPNSITFAVSPTAIARRSGGCRRSSIAASAL